MPKQMKGNMCSSRNVHKINHIEQRGTGKRKD